MTEALGDTKPAPTQQSAPLFEARGVTKAFGSVIANRDISLAVHAGEKHALLGENGAGKSTFVKMIDGVLRPDSGAFFWNGRRVSIGSPATARRLGIGMVFQHFASFEALTVAENIALALPGVSLGTIRRTIRDIGERYGLAVDPKRRVERLSAGEKQRVEIVRALMQKPKLLILDEPTSVLTPQEADDLFKTLNALASDGMALIYISHRLQEISAFCDTATVLRDGAVAGSCDPKMTSVSAMAEMMIGKIAEPIRKQDAYIGGVRLKVEDLSLPVREGVALRNVSFGARRGEILGIAGVAGEGQDTLFSALSGERRTPYRKAVQLDGKPIGALGPTARRRLGAAFAPEQRVGHAAIGDLSLSENLRLTRHGLRGSGRHALRHCARKIRETFDVRASKGDPRAGTLSGGNLQKFVIGRELDRDPNAFVVAQPTWGVDAGAAAAIRGNLMDLAGRGAAVVVISQDLDEIFQIADRVAVIHRGQLSETYLVDDMTPEKIGMLMAGATPADLLTADLAPPPAPSQPRIVPPEIDKTVNLAKPRIEAPAARPNVETAAATPIPPQTATVLQKLTLSGTVTTPWTPREEFHRLETQS